jgi:hypothetical protein
LGNYLTGGRADALTIPFAGVSRRRDIIQLRFTVPLKGTGMIPLDKIVRTTTNWIADCLKQSMFSASGGLSEVGLKSYVSRKLFRYESTLIWLDEETYMTDVECLLRSMVVNGMLLVTATLCWAHGG